MTIPRAFFYLLPGLVFLALGVLWYVLRTAGMVVAALWRAARGE